MKIRLYLIFVSFLFSLTSNSQIITEEIPILLKTEKAVYTSGETIKLTFSFDTLEVVHSNFGGCGGGPAFIVRSINNPIEGDIHPDQCDYLLDKPTFSSHGTFEIAIRYPGIYSIVLYTRNNTQDFVNSDGWNPIRSNEFEVVKK